MLRAACFLILISLLSTLGSPLLAATVHVAVAANFAPTLATLTPRFTEQTGIAVVVSSASSGTLFAQALHGAPYDLFLSADSEKPTQLIARKIAHADSAVVYARGQLALWQPAFKGSGFDSQSLRAINGHLAIANPRTAPYGVASAQVLRALGLDTQVSNRLVQGESIAQTWQFVANGNASAGFVAWPQLLANGHAGDAGVWQVPSTLHAPIEQVAVTLTSGKNIDGARQLLEFLMSADIQADIVRAGYLATPTP